MKKSTSNNNLNSQVVNSLVSKKRLEVYMEYAKARANAKESRDEKIMKKITKLEKELIKLEKKAEKTIALCSKSK